MARSIERKIEANRAAIYARVSDKSQAEEDKTSLSEQTIDMEAYCERRGLTISGALPGGWQGLVKEAPRVPAYVVRCTRGTL